MVKERLEFLRQRIENICKKSGRDSDEVELVAVVKGVDLSKIKEARKWGITQFGENRVKEAEEKIRVLGDSSIIWHLIGHLQRNKAKKAIDLFDCIQSVDSILLLEKLESILKERGKILNIMIEVNISGEVHKYGLRDQRELLVFTEKILESKHLKLIGLMGIGPYGVGEDRIRESFRLLKRLKEEVDEFLISRGRGSLRYLSMGMSEDFEIAIEEGSNMLRLGRILFDESFPFDK